MEIEEYKKKLHARGLGRFFKAGPPKNDKIDISATNE